MTAKPDLPLTAPVPTVLLLADISGYTRYIKENAFTMAHALRAVSALLDSVIDRLEPVFRLSKLEGDAAFCHAAPAAVQADASGLESILLATFAAFEAQKASLIAANTCRCRACEALDTLDLKIILHKGDVLHFATRRSMELGGLPVICLHRLSKNDIEDTQYILWTDDMAYLLKALQPVENSVEHYDELGRLNVQVYRALPGRAPLPRVSAWRRWCNAIGKAVDWLPLNLRGTAGKAAAFAGQH